MSNTRLSELRAELARQELDGFIVPRADEHLGEYVPASAERLAWLTGFTGSAGLAVVLADRAAVFTDGRYVLQLAAQTDAALWERRHITEEPPPAWLAAHAPAGRAHRLRPAADRRGGPGPLHRGRADHGAGRPQPDRRGLDRPAAAAARARRAAPAGAMPGRSADEKRAEIASAADARPSRTRRC